MADDPVLSPERFIGALLDSPTPSLALTEVGTVTEVGDGIAVVSGLARALADELLIFASGVRGVVLDLEPDRLGVILLGPSQLVSFGEDVWRTHKVFSVPVGPGLVGRIVDATGEPRDGKGSVISTAQRPVEANAPGILSRAPVTRPLATGIKAIDGAVPVGLGQRELIIGDRQTGKTSIAVDSILNQARSEVLSIY
ncbi:MAG: F0F1 ATP synthase subunit alpha, partial [Marinobacter sp.]|nr:F0F1 ATP synthase subunit alpha [Marinobacter sp.]